MKRIFSLVLVLTLLLTTFPLTLSAAKHPAWDLIGTNESANDYGNYANPVKSHLTVLDDGSLMCVTYTDKFGIDVSYFTAEYKMTKNLTIKEELPIFGGFYATEDAYYILSGQENLKENDSVEVFRVTKYNKNWKRLNSVGLYGANTTIPFDAGSARFAHDGKVLFIRTCHEMYALGDGINHQANVTFSVNTDEMKIIDANYVISSNKTGYVSHSFNQFIKYTDEGLVTIDHGDAHPRTICFMKYRSYAYKTDYFPDRKEPIQQVSMFDIPGESGDNYTGVTVGGFEVTPTAYIVAGTSKLLTYPQSNVYISVLKKDGQKAEVTYLTDYKVSTSSSITASYDNTVTAPHLIKISSKFYMILWTKGGYIYYQVLNKNGEKHGSRYKLKGKLSDCVPVVADGKIQWYTYNGSKATFYSIPTSDIGKATQKTADYGHKYVQKSNYTYHWLECTKCSKVIDKAKHYNKETTTKKVFTADGKYVTACDTCDYAFKSQTVSVKLHNPNGGSYKVPIVKVGSKEWRENKDYAVSIVSENSKKVTYRFYKNNIYYSEFRKTFINLKGSAKVSSVGSQTYTGKAVKPTVKVTVDGKTLKKGTDYKLKYENNTKIGTATVTVTGTGEKYFGVIKKTFKIIPQKPVISSIKTKTKKAMLVSWKKKSGLNGYQIIYSTNKEFKDKKTVTVSSAKNYKTIFSLKSGKIYYVKLRSFKTVDGKRYYSSYSTMKKIRVK